MSGRRMAAALLSRCSFAVRSTARVEVQAAGRYSSVPSAQTQQHLALRTTPVLPGRNVCRSFATDGASDLKEALDAEIDFEINSPSEVQNLPSEPPSPWTLTETVGDSKLELKRPYNSEDIIVTIIADEAGNNEPGGSDQETPIDNEEFRNFEDLDVGIVAEARIIRGDHALDINFRSDGTYVQVLDVSLGDPQRPSREQDDTAYAGPRYEELDENVQKAFDEYLKKRGITAEFGEYLMKLTEDKEQREYIHWLQKVHKLFT